MAQVGDTLLAANTPTKLSPLGDHEDAVPDRPTLHGVVVCCTSITPERRSAIAEKAQAMGAIHKLDLTSDVTHLIVGSIDTPKYKYVAKERADIKALKPEWIDAVLEKWREGGDVDVAALEEEWRCPTFDALQICVTGFEDQRQRDAIQDDVVRNGATYSGDLTKSVTHLIAAAPRGKKYEYALQWNIKPITLEWLSDSLTRGMALDESYYNPLLPIEDRGTGAITRKEQISPNTLRKRQREIQTVSMEEMSRRKLRRTTSSRLESQNDDLWADIGTGEAEDSKNKDSAWGDSANVAKSATRSAHVTATKASAAEQASLGAQETSTSAGDEHQEDEKGTNDSIFQGTRVHIAGFEQRKEAILVGYLEANGAQVVDHNFFRLREQEASQNDSVLDSPRVTVVLPCDTSEHRLQTLKQDQLSQLAPEDSIVSEWWIEKCIFSKSLISQESPFCSPIGNEVIPGFERLTVCPTSFTGIDLLHFSKAVKSKGAKYDETLTPNISVLVCNEGAPRRDKIKYALEYCIPIVSASWFYRCIAQHQLLPFEDFALSSASQDHQVPRLIFYHPSSNPNPAATKRQHGIAKQADGAKKNHPQAVAHTKPSKPNDDTRNQDPHHKSVPSLKSNRPSQQTHSQPLQDLHPSMNSSHRSFRQPSNPNSPSTDKRPSPSKPQTTSGYDGTADDTEHHQPSRPSEPNTTEPTNPAPLDTAIALLLAHKKSSNNPTPLPATASSAASLPVLNRARRHRPLGRAPSNPKPPLTDQTPHQPGKPHKPSLPIADSYASTPSHSLSLDCESGTQDPHTSLQGHAQVEESFSFRPSQALGYEDPEMVRARRKVGGRGSRSPEEADGEKVGVGRVRDLKVSRAEEGGEANPTPLGKRRGARASRMRE
ncbi:MAG: hypothetical protein M1828_000718 [Chrysothrix sp. TS-e1954]|nr:MAG: hypothetical protein M1828_000718 [Chrysothrix sp. TS-e1954]